MGLFRPQFWHDIEFPQYILPDIFLKTDQGVPLYLKSTNYHSSKTKTTEMAISELGQKKVQIFNYCAQSMLKLYYIM